MVGFIIMDNALNKMYRGVDARSLRGRLARGSNVYKGYSNTPNPMDLRKGAKLKLRKKRRVVTPKRFI